MNTNEIILIVALIVAVVFALLWWTDRRSINKYLRGYEKANSDAQSLRERVSELEQSLKSARSGGGSSSKKDKASAPAATPAAAQPVAAASAPAPKLEKGKKIVDEAEFKKLKEDNFRMKDELKELRRQVSGRSAAGGEAERLLAQAREELDNYRVALEERSSELEALRESQRRLTEEASRRRPAAQTAAEGEQADGAAAAAAAAEIERRDQQLADLRAELERVRKESRSELDKVRREARDGEKQVARELRNASRALGRVQARADNNHKAFMIARSQLLVAEQRLAALDPSYTPPTTFPTNDRGIEEALKKFQTRDARLEKELQDGRRAVQRLAELEKTLAARGIDLSAPAAPAASSEAEASVAAPGAVQIRRKGGAAPTASEKGERASQEQPATRAQKKSKKSASTSRNESKIEQTSSEDAAEAGQDLAAPAATAEAPVAEAPVAEAPVAEAPVAEPSLPAPAVSEDETPPVEPAPQTTDDVVDSAVVVEPTVVEPTIVETAVVETTVVEPTLVEPEPEAAAEDDIDSGWGDVDVDSLLDPSDEKKSS